MAPPRLVRIQDFTCGQVWPKTLWRGTLLGTFTPVPRNFSFSAYFAREYRESVFYNGFLGTPGAGSQELRRGTEPKVPDAVSRLRFSGTT